MLYIVSVDFDEALGCIVLKLYDSSTDTITYHYDTNFAPYFLSEKKFLLEGIVKQELVDRYDALNDINIKVWQTIVNHQNVIMGLNKKIAYEKEKGNTFPYIVWENYIKYFQSYIYDNDIKIGMPYVREKGVLMLNIDHEAETRVKELVKLVNPDESRKILCAEIAKLLEYPAPEFKRISLDIEVLNDGKIMPNPESATMPIIAVCMQSNIGERFVFALIQGDKPFSCYDNATKVQFFSSERDLILAIFEFAKNYPFIITFNGDEFDLPYLATRAARLDIPSSKIPITVQNRITLWKDTIHIDLYKFFVIKSMQTYAFQQKYKNVDLDTISKALIGEGKYRGEHEWVGDMSYEELLIYCMKDAELTMRLTTFNNNIVMNLILVLSRLSYMPIEHVSRKPISQWIRSMIYYEHRKQNVIIPRSEDIILLKGQTTTQALIKGKKYKGATVIDPVAGFHFKTLVGDFASLYPSIMKNYNLGYATVNCPHLNDWDLIDNRTKRFIYWICYIIIHNKGIDIKCQVEELKKLMKNIEKGMQSGQEIIVNETEKELMRYKETLMQEIKPNQNSNFNEENKTNDIWKLIEKNIMIIINGGKETYENEQNQTQNLIENLKIVETAQFEDNYKRNDKNSIIQKETNAKNVEILTIDALKSIIWTEEKSGEIAVNLLKKIGTDYNSFVQTVIRLNILGNQSCKDNKFANMPHWICHKNKAIEGRLIGTLKDLRVVWYKKRGKDKTEPRKEWYSVAEQSIKVICNAAYGVFASDDFALYCPPVSEYITGIGRFIISQTIAKAQSFGLNILYGDTDSIFIKDPPQEKLDELMTWAMSEFNIDFELDKHYRYICFSSRKKNYLGVLENGDVDVKGLTAKKKHTPKIFKDVFSETKKLLAEIQKLEDVPAKRAEILKLVKTTYSKLKQRKWESNEDLAFHVTLSKRLEDYDKTEPQHVKAAKYLLSKGYNVGQGLEVSYIKTMGKERVKPTNLTKTEEVDVKKYIEFLKSAFNQILEPLGIDWDGDILGVCQLSKFCNMDPKDLNST